MSLPVCPHCNTPVLPTYGMCPICDYLMDPTTAHQPFPDSTDSQD